MDTIDLPPPPPEVIGTPSEPPDYAMLERELGRAQAEEVIREFERAEAMSQIARYRHYIAKNHHKLKNGKDLDFDKYPFAVELYTCDAQSMVVMGSVQWGKAGRNSSQIHTPDGWRRMGDIKVGDRVSTPFGGSAAVLGVFPQGRVQLYRVTFADGRATEASGEHLWEVYRAKRRWKASRGAFHIRPKTAEVITTTQIREALGNDKFFTILPQPVESPAKDLPIDPYLLGQFLGDGAIGGKKISYASADQELVNSANNNLGRHGCELIPSGKYDHYLRMMPLAREAAFAVADRIKNPFKLALQSLGLLGTNSFTKFIPQIYKDGSIEQRRAILQGLLDTDRYASKSISYNSASSQLAEDVAYIVRSLGGIAKTTIKEASYLKRGIRHQCAVSHKVNIRHPDPRSLFRLNRKIARATSKYQFKETLKLAIKSIEPVGEDEATCIYVDHPRHLYLADNFCVTHNTEFAIVTCAAMADYGLKVFFVFSKIEKRNKVVADRIDPAFASIPLYRAMSEGARKERKALADSTGLKHFGKGGINFVGSNSEKDFTSFDADVAVIDEHQECDQDNISGVFERMSGSPYRFQIILGNPRLTGTKENNNLDWQYQQSDQRQWHVPCDNCGHLQVLDWWQHFIEEKKSATGAILTIDARDTEWDAEGVLDMRPICLMCKRPMDRLNREGRWVARNPGHRRRGYNLSNLYNVNVRMGGPDSLLERYISAQYSPLNLAKFWNDQLGLAFTQDGTNITDRMLAQASTGEGCNLPPYLFAPADQLKWNALDAEAA